MHLTRSPARLAYVDSARGLACLLAIAAHLGHGQFDYAEHPAFAWMTLFTRTATPTFMTLFGVMIAIVYLPRLAAGGVAGEAVPRRLVARMITCYLVFGAITLAALASGKIGAEKALLAMLYMDDGRYGEILKIYAGLFLVILVALPLVRRYGFWAFAGLASAGWALKLLLAGALPPGNYLLQVIFGYDRGFGPSLLLGFTFVAFGVAIGETIGGRRGLLRPAVLWGAGLALLGHAALTTSPVALARSVAGFQARSTNDPLYFAFGIVASGAILLGFAWLWRRDRPVAPVPLLATIGTRSLFFYGFGNVAINLLPTYHGNPFVGFLLSLMFLAGLTVVTVDLAKSESRLDRLSGGLLSGFHHRYDEAMSALLHLDFRRRRA